MSSNSYSVELVSGTADMPISPVIAYVGKVSQGETQQAFSEQQMKIIEEMIKAALSDAKKAKTAAKETYKQLGIVLHKGEYHVNCYGVDSIDTESFGRHESYEDAFSAIKKHVDPKDQHGFTDEEIMRMLYK